jgi:hypothetical protein
MDKNIDIGYNILSDDEIVHSLAGKSDNEGEKNKLRFIFLSFIVMMTV